MLRLVPDALGDAAPPTVVALGAHCDDIEIGAGATLLRLAEAYPGLRVLAVIVTGSPQRVAEARVALPTFLPGADLRIETHGLADGRLPAAWNELKEIVESARRTADQLGGADLVLAPNRDDAHQDHRLLAEIVPTCFRDHFVLGYEILKWDGDLGRPNVYLGVDEATAERKVALLHEHYPSQHTRTWFDRESFLSLMRVRGVECNQRYAEAFSSNKILLAPRAVPGRAAEGPGPDPRSAP